MQLELPVVDTTTNIGLGQPHNVILFNDEHHTMDEVANQIMHATNCGAEKAFWIMMEAHNSGRAIAFSGSLERCEHVESILAEIRLSTKIEQA